jgi:hypothetical protein
MIRKSVCIIFCLIVFHLTSYSQHKDIFMPLQFQRAYEKGTRSWDGKPGPRYWQNTARYKIQAEYDPVSRIIAGSEVIIYINNSPDTLNYIVTKLLQNLYKKGNARDQDIIPELITDGVEVNLFTVRGKIFYKDNLPVLNGKSPYWVQLRGTNLLVILRDNPIYPGEELEIRAEWRLTLPEKALIRTGYWDSTSFFAGYWYPQIAVYDDITGWDLNSYTGIQETYSENSDYEVEVTLPADYVVWATGEQQNENEIFKKNILARIENSRSNDGFFRIIEADDYKKGVITGGEKKTWVFKAHNVPDFAWAASDHFIWDATSLPLDHPEKRRIWINSVYPQNENDYSNVIHYGRYAIEFLSTVSPGVPYPYSKHITFHGLLSGGMEYPMMADNDFFSDSAMFMDVTAHEIAHTYFPFYVHINEREYAWMDEGWTTVFGHQVILSKGYSRLDFFDEPTAGYSIASMYMDNTPLMVTSSMLTYSVMENNYYIKPAQANFLLIDLMKESGIKNPIHEFINRWAGKHPTPYDFFFTMEDIIDEDLSWFWNPWFFEFGYPDLAIKEVIQTPSLLEIVIERKGNQPVPVHLDITFSDDLTETDHESIRIWKDGKTEYNVFVKTDKKVQKIILGNEEIPDANPKDNAWKSQGSL